MEKQIENFFKKMEIMGVEIEDWKAYPPKSFNGITFDKIVIDTDKGIFAVDRSLNIYTYGKKLMNLDLPHLDDR